jgi:hypothetical protein
VALSVFGRKAQIAFVTGLQDREAGGGEEPILSLPSPSHGGEGEGTGWPLNDRHWRLGEEAGNHDALDPRGTDDSLG